MIPTLPLAVAVIAGGPSSEANVSRASAAAVAAALESAGHHAQLLELDAGLCETLRRHRFDVAFPTTHGALGEDGCLQGLLEVLDLPYVGSGVLASALGMSKPHAKAMFRAAGLPLADELVVRRGADVNALAASARRTLGRAVVVKPAASGSAIGVTLIAESAADSELAAALEQAFELGETALLESFVSGEEVTCGVLEDERGVPHALPPTLIVSKAASWYDFKSRYASGGSQHQCPAPLSRELTELVQQVAVAAHRAIGARDLCRADFVVGDSVTLLEVNTLPGMTATSLFPEAAGVAGITFPELCDRLARRAHARPRRQRPAELPMP